MFPIFSISGNGNPEHGSYGISIHGFIVLSALGSKR